MLVPFFALAAALSPVVAVDGADPAVRAAVVRHLESAGFTTYDLRALTLRALVVKDGPPRSDWPAALRPVWDEGIAACRAQALRPPYDLRNEAFLRCATSLQRALVPRLAAQLGARRVVRIDVTSSDGGWLQPKAWTVAVTASSIEGGAGVVLREVMHPEDAILARAGGLAQRALAGEGEASDVAPIGGPAPAAPRFDAAPLVLDDAPIGGQWPRVCPRGAPRTVSSTPPSPSLQNAWVAALATTTLPTAERALACRAYVDRTTPARPAMVADCEGLPILVGEGPTDKDAARRLLTKVAAAICG